MGHATILLVIVAVATALPLDSNVPTSDNNIAVRNSALESLVLDLLEGLRDVMLVGAGDDIPVLDPLQIDNLHLDLGELLGFEEYELIQTLDDKTTSSHLTLGEVEARQLSTFVIDDLTITMTSVLLQRYDFEIEGHIPVLEIDAGHYDLNVNAMGFHFFGAGDAKIVLIEPRIKADVELALSIFGGLSVTLRSAHVVFQLGQLEPQLTGMFNNPMTDQFINLFIKHLVEDAVVVYEAEISEIISALVLEIGNELLADLDLGGLLPSAAGEAIASAALQIKPPGEAIASSALHVKPLTA